MTAGIQFGRYAIRGTLGQGGFATVYRAWDPMLSREVALKALLPHLAMDAGVRQRFLDEARALAGLRHPNIVSVYDVGEADGRPFFAMELLEGDTLAALPGPGYGLDLDEVVRIVESIASALDYLHAAGIVHRDIKAANLMRDLSGRVVLMDFGIARQLDRSPQTRTGASLGTAETMAPEQVSGEPAGPPADIYALGVLTYQLLSGRVPFVGNTPHVLYAQVHEQPRPLSELRPDLPPGVSHAVEWALAKEPSERPPTSDAFARALAGITSPVRAGLIPSLNPVVIASAIAIACLSLLTILLIVRGSGAHSEVATREASGPTLTATVSPAARSTATAATSAPTASVANAGQPPVITEAAKYSSGDIVRADADPCLNERERASMDAQVLDCMARGINLRIVAGPLPVQGQTWWQVTGWNGSGLAGWVDQAYLVPSLACNQSHSPAVCDLGAPTPTPVSRDTLPAVPDLSQPPSPAGAGDPSFKIIGITPAGPARAGQTFEFRITAANSGGTAGISSISASSPNASTLSASLDGCSPDIVAKIWRPGDQITKFAPSKDRTAGRISASYFLAEAQFNSGWPAGTSCTLVVRAPVPANGTITFWLRATGFARNGNVKTWPYGTGVDTDQQGQWALRWDVPVLSP